MATYRSDIQALRALAVVLVVVFHLWPERLSGGYIGVDVFFVISGYLITAHLLREADTTGTVKVGTFWARRIRRLLPAAFLVLAATLVMVFLALPRSLWPDTLRHIAASALYVENWALGLDAVDYLAAEASATAVQHYWSLSIEEQFYLVWPLLIVAALWVARRVGGRGSAGRPIAVALLLVFVASGIASVLLTNADPAWAYFATFTRAWEFAAGGLVALLPVAVVRRVGAAAPAAVTASVSWLALAVIVATAVVLDGATPFPGWVAAVPVAATCVLLLVGEQRAVWSPQRLARIRPIQAVGDMSYAIYLWHWPLIVVAPFVIGSELRVPSKIVIVVLTLALAFATQRLVEDPLRRPGGALRGSLRAYGFTAAGMAVVLVAALVPAAVVEREASERVAALTAVEADPAGCTGAYAIVNGCADPYVLSPDVDPAAAPGDFYRATPLFSGDSCSRNSPVADPCVLGAGEDGSPTIALLGDSHAEQLLVPLANAAAERGWELRQFTKQGCSGFEDEATARERGQTNHVRYCVPWGDDVAAAIAASPDIDVVLIVSRYAGKPGTVDAARERIAAFRDAGKQVVMMRDIPAPAEDAPPCIESARGQADPCAWRYAPAEGFLLDAAVAEDAPVFDVDDIICSDDGRCHAVIGGLVAYRDDNHLTASFAATLTTVLGERVAAQLTAAGVG